MAQDITMTILMDLNRINLQLGKIVNLFIQTNKFWSGRILI